MFTLHIDGYGKPNQIMRVDGDQSKSVLSFTGKQPTEDFALEMVRALNDHFNPDRMNRHNERSTIRCYVGRKHGTLCGKPFRRSHFDNNLEMSFSIFEVMDSLPQGADLAEVVFTIRPEEAGR